MKTTVAAIDFGTSKIVTLVAENSGSQRCDIVAAGVAKYDGYLEEGWNNPGQLDEAIRLSISDAEEQANTKIREINVGVPGAFTSVFATKVTVALKGTDPRVTSADVKAAFAKAAEDEGFPEIARKFALIAEIEKCHAGRFETFHRLLKDGKLSASDQACDWICLNCGHEFNGKGAPQTCPVCGHEQGFFIRVPQSPYNYANGSSC